MGPDSCGACRELISADLDGEADDAERAELAEHLSTCADCAIFAAEAAGLHRTMRIAPAAPVPDLTGAILERVAATPPVAEPAATRRSRRSRVRVYAMQYGLLVVALAMVVLAVPELLASTGGAVHTSRHLGGWDLAFAVGLMLAALQPWRARGLLPMAFALAGVMAVTAGLDIARGYTPGIAEGSHLLEVFGLVFLWLLSRSVPGESRPGSRRPARGSGDAVASSGVARLRVLPTRFGLIAPASTSPVLADSDEGERAA